ncbi:MAG TPA: acyl-CoA thioesterase [Thiolapillus brandeum]|uniref:Acyl-CoA thioesterase n=1 Tax=Thiolapillus brandeum TaxID=1076588 RepID=A0A831RZB2_9GAMM|nr:acyl-CoA thioesterase [Thiolapillus brandeum]
MKPFEYCFQVRFQDLDPAGILFFARLFDHVHDAYAALLADAGYSLKAILESGEYLIPLVHAEADYLQPLRLDDHVCVTVTAEATGNSSLNFSYTFHKDGTRCAIARTTHVFIGSRSKKPVPVPEQLLRRLASSS